MVWSTLNSVPLSGHDSGLTSLGFGWVLYTLFTKIVYPPALCLNNCFLIELSKITLPIEMGFSVLPLRVGLKVSGSGQLAFFSINFSSIFHMLLFDATYFWQLPCVFPPYWLISYFVFRNFVCNSSGIFSSLTRIEPFLSYSNNVFCKGLVLPETSVDGASLGPISRLAIPPSWCRFAPEPDFIPSPSSSNDQSQR